MIIDPTPLGILLGSSYNAKYDSKFSTSLNRFDHYLLLAAKGWKESTPARIENEFLLKKLRRPLLSSEIYYNYLLGMQEELTPAGMFASPEKSQVYLDVMQHGAIGSSLEDITRLFRAELGTIFTYEEAVIASNTPFLKQARVVKEVLAGLGRISPTLHEHASKPEMLYLAIDPEQMNCKYGVGAMIFSTVVSTLGEIYCKIELTLEKFQEIYLYMSPLGKIKFMSLRRITKQDLKSVISHLGYHRNWSQGYRPSLYKMILMSLLYNIYKESGDLFDFVLSSAAEQQRSIVREGLLAGLNSKSIKPPQDGSLTDLVWCLSDRVTWEK